MVAADVVVGELGAALLGQPVGFHDARVDVDRDRHAVADAAARGPRPPKRDGRDDVELAGVAPSETPKERPQRGRGQDDVAQDRLGRSRTQHVRVVDTVAAGQRRVDQRHRLVADMGVTSRRTQIDMGVEQASQTQMLRQRRGQDQPGISHRVTVVEGHREPVESMRCWHQESALRTRGHGWLGNRHPPRSGGTST